MLVVADWQNVVVSHCPFYLWNTIAQHILLSNGHVPIGFIPTHHVIDDHFSFLVWVRNLPTCVLTFNTEKVAHDSLLRRNLNFWDSSVLVSFVTLCREARGHNGSMLIALGKWWFWEISLEMHNIAIGLEMRNIAIFFFIDSSKVPFNYILSLFFI